MNGMSVKLRGQRLSGGPAAAAAVRDVQQQKACMPYCSYVLPYYADSTYSILHNNRAGSFITMYYVT